MSMNRDK